CSTANLLMPTVQVSPAKMAHSWVVAKRRVLGSISFSSVCLRVRSASRNSLLPLIKRQLDDACRLGLPAHVDLTFGPDFSQLRIDVRHRHGFLERRSKRAARHPADLIPLVQDRGAFARHSFAGEFQTDAPAQRRIVAPF